MQAILHEGLSKSEVLAKFGCVIGVQNANFSVQEGEVFCIMGLSGSGKSTLVRHINRLLEPTRGQIFIQGEDVIKKDEKQLRMLRADKIGMVFQNVALMPHRTVLDNVALPLDVKRMNRSQRRQTVEQVLEMVELSGWEYHYAHELSGGMQQRVGLARAMAADPADAYVREFVADISQLKLISAAGIMLSLETYTGDLRALETAPRVSEDSALEDLIDISLQHQGPLVIHDTARRDVGFIDQEQLLRSVIGTRGPKHGTSHD